MKGSEAPIQPELFGRMEECRRPDREEELRRRLEFEARATGSPILSLDGEPELPMCEGVVQPGDPSTKRLCRRPARWFFLYPRRDSFRARAYCTQHLKTHPRLDVHDVHSLGPIKLDQYGCPVLPPPRSGRRRPGE